MPRKLLRAHEAFEILAVPRPTGYRLVEQGDLPAVRIGRSIRIDPDDLSRFIEARRTHPRRAGGTA